VPDSEVADFFVAGAREANLRNRQCAVSLHFEFQGTPWREVFVPERTSLVCEDDLIGSQSGGILEGGFDVFLLEFRICNKNDLTRLAGGELFQKQMYGNSGSMLAGFSHHHVSPCLNEFQKLHTADFTKMFQV
jgi:hypothetical protein